MNSPAPILYEVNTRVWLSELSNRLKVPITLAEVPDSEIERWLELGFTHIWLMGLWQVGPKAREFALDQWKTHWRNEFASEEKDVQGSPFAIQEYAVDERLGHPLDLLMLKERLGRAGLKLIVDFVPNHFGLDTAEPARYPARFVQATTGSSDTFRCETKTGVRYFAHGRDPYFPPWLDTVQVDYRVAEAQEAMSLVAQTISMFGEGLRCDMAMLMLPDIFRETWKNFPSAGVHTTSVNFWSKTIPKIRNLQPNVELIAEAYWDREQELQDAGFDFTYNKRVTDFLVRGQHEELLRFLENCEPNYLRRSVHFLENHDEARIASVLPLRHHKAAAALILFLPGMALLHDGQLEGRKHHAHIQMSKRQTEQVDSQLQGFYHELLTILPKTRIRRGKPKVQANDDSGVVISWVGREGGIDIGVVNLGSEPKEFKLEMSGKYECLYSTDPGIEIMNPNRVLLPPESAHILRFG